MFLNTKSNLCRYCPGLKNEVCTNVKNTETSDCTEKEHTYTVTELFTKKKYWQILNDSPIIKERAYCIY